MQRQTATIAIGRIAICAALTLLAAAHLCHAAPAKPAQGADDPRAREIVDQVARLFSGKSSVATLKMQVAGQDSPRDL